MSAVLTVRLEEATIEALDRLAEKTERSRDRLVADAVENYVALNAWQLAKIESGIAAADRGDFASDEDLLLAKGKFAIRP